MEVLSFLYFNSENQSSIFINLPSLSIFHLYQSSIFIVFQMFYYVDQHIAWKEAEMPPVVIIFVQKNISCISNGPQLYSISSRTYFLSNRQEEFQSNNRYIGKLTALLYSRTFLYIFFISVKPFVSSYVSPLAQTDSQQREESALACQLLVNQLIYLSLA